MSKELGSWPRKYHAPGDGEAFLYFVAFGEIAQDRPLSVRKYRCNRLPRGFECAFLERPPLSDYIDRFRQGFVWEQFVAENPTLARSVKQCTSCVVLRGSRKNPRTLDYLRDCVGLLTYFLDNGACAIHDPQLLKWWSPDHWRERIFEPNAPVPRSHVVILYSQEEHRSDLLWFHTRGMRKFGRPDISVRNVGPSYREAVIDLCERFIEYQAFGGVVAEGQEVQMASLPSGGRARHRGDVDDRDFNNVHVEFVWPKSRLSM